MNVDLETSLFSANHGIGLPGGLAAARAELDRRKSIFAADAMAWQLHAYDRDAEALVLAEEALRLGTANALFHFHRSQIRLALGLHDAARADLARALELSPHFSILHAGPAAEQLQRLESQPEHWVERADTTAGVSIAPLPIARGADAPREFGDKSRRSRTTPMALTDERVPFSPIDEAAHLLDTPAEPWSIQLEVRVAGALDDARLRAAVPVALGRHPMARAKLLPARRTDKRWTWAITGAPDLDPLKVLDCDDDAALAQVRSELHSLSVPLAESPPLRLRLARHRLGDVLMVNANHAAFDGFGTLQVLRSIAKAYLGEPEPDSEVDFRHARDVEALTRPESRSDQARRLRALAVKALDFAVPPARLARQGGSDRPGYGIHQISVPVPPTPENATVNDVLVAALNLAIAGWNTAQGVSCRRIGVLMPVNLRPPQWRSEVVTNFVSESRVSTTPADRRTSERTVATVAAQTRRIKEGEGAALMELLSRTARLPLWLKQPLSPFIWMTGNRLIDTAVLSNLGALDDDELPDFGADAGEVVGMWFSAPARMPCGLSLGAITAAGALHLAFRYRYPMWGPAAAAAFADHFVIELGILERELI